MLSVCFEQSFLIIIIIIIIIIMIITTTIATIFPRLGNTGLMSGRG